MLFSSITFIFLFLPLLLIAYQLSGMRTAVLLAGSIVFYTWGEGVYLLLLCALIALNHAAAHGLERLDGIARKTLLISILGVDLGILGVFKYAGFIADNLNTLLPVLKLPRVDVALPLGISFFTFQLVSYLVDVHRKQVAPEKHWLRFATYILMFPHLIAGPIVRYAEIREELARRTASLERFGLGVQYFIVGLCQKTLIANTLAPVANHAFGLPLSTLSTGDAWSGIAAYSLQIYFDFCGYSNMAIGLAFMLGFTFPRNFDYPYASRSVTEFWRRWHISLSSWFRDYVYIPLGGSRGNTWRTVRNLLIVFLLTGLWHGAAWNFIAWGLLHGGCLLLERFWLARRLRHWPGIVGNLYTLAAVMTAWVFFRADGVGHACGYLKQMLDFSHAVKPGNGMRILINPEVLMASAFGVVLAWPNLPRLLDRIDAPRVTSAGEPGHTKRDTLHTHILPTPVLLTGFVLACTLLLGSTLNPFLYFRF